jgi:hypothetical protein
MDDYDDITGMRNPIFRIMGNEMANNNFQNLNLNDMQMGMNQGTEINFQNQIYLINDDLPFLHNIVLREGDLNYYDNPLKELCIHNNNILPNNDLDEIPTYKFESIEMNNLEANYSKVILLVGKTGDGKTTWINFLINALLGVRFDDNYRFKMIVEKENDQTKSITRGVHEYNINIRGYLPIKIIDCQGFGDTNCITEDKKLVSKLKDLFDSIKRIDCICYVIKEGDLRLDGLSKYIYNSIVSLFGKNVQKNFVFLATFSNFDTKLKNDMLKKLKNKDSLFREIIPFLEEPYYFQFENGSFYKKRNVRDKLNFTDSMENMNNFLKKKLIKLESIPLKDSIEVLRERLELESYCNNILNNRKLLIDKRKDLLKTKEELLEKKKKLLKIMK